MDSSASAHPAASHLMAGTGSGPQLRTSWVSEGAGTYAVASHGTSASASAATTAAVNAPLTRRAAATSCANRARNPASSANSILIVLTATSRPAVDRPRNTWPIAPAPSLPSSAYGPMRSGSHRRSGSSAGCTTMIAPSPGPPAHHYDAESEGPCARFQPVWRGSCQSGHSSPAGPDDSPVVPVTTPPPGNAYFSLARYRTPRPAAPQHPRQPEPAPAVRPGRPAHRPG